jgi:DUF4097 and DUF4098 domain-containing protein YvlB
MASRWITITVSLALFGSAGRAVGQVQEPFRWSGVVEPGKTLEVRGINGDIEASGAEGTAAEVRASKEGEDDDPREVRIEVVEDAQGVLICAVYPNRRGERPNECHRDRQNQQLDDHDVTVDFVVRVPAGVRLVARTVNGSITATGIRADTEVSTVNGKVEVASTGTVSANTVNGSIEATMGRERWTGKLEFHTVNGSVTLRMPAGTNAVVEGETVNGDLESDFPLTLEANRQWGPRKFEGAIGEGGGRLSIETVNGGIRLVRTS